MQLVGAQKGRQDDGATAVEYGLLISLIAVIIAAVVATLGGSVLGAFGTMIGTF